MRDQLSYFWLCCAAPPNSKFQMFLLAGLNYSASKVLWNFTLEVINMADVLGSCRNGY